MTEYTPGQRVHVLSGRRRYPGTVREVRERQRRGREYLVRCDDGDTVLVPAELMEPAS